MFRYVVTCSFRVYVILTGRDPPFLPHCHTNMAVIYFKRHYTVFSFDPSPELLKKKSMIILVVADILLLYCF